MNENLTSNPLGPSTAKAVDPKPRPHEKSEEFGKFEALARKLVKVPKKELDEKRKDEP